jgi:hypothetical protein
MSEKKALDGSFLLTQDESNKSLFTLSASVPQWGSSSQTMSATIRLLSIYGDQPMADDVISLYHLLINPFF